MTHLMYAAKGGDEELVETLLTANADLEVQDKVGVHTVIDHSLQMHVWRCFIFMVNTVPYYVCAHRKIRFVLRSQCVYITFSI